MKINKELIEQLADDCMLYLTEKEKEEILNLENEILEKFEKVIKIDTTNVEPLHHPFDIQNSYLRSDEDEKRITQQDMLKNAPSVENDYVTIVKVVK